MKHMQIHDDSSAPVTGEVAGGDSDAARLVGSDRVLAVLKELARYPDGVGLEELTRVIGSPKPTVHRALGALRRAGLADQGTRGRYVLGDEFLRMAFAHHEARPSRSVYVPYSKRWPTGLARRRTTRSSTAARSSTAPRSTRPRAPSG